jgi:transposase-like protein
MDTTYFGRDFGVMVFRGNPVNSSKFINLRWKYLKSETVKEYYYNIYTLTQKYKIKSFTVDNKGGLIKMLERRYPNTPIQLCQFHMVAGVMRLTTRNPKSECGKDLKQLILKLKHSSKNKFKQHLTSFLHTHINYLQQRNHTGKYIHEDLRQAVSSVTRNLKYLFTYESYPTQIIPKTTNSAEGSFGQWKYKVRLHRGVSKSRKVQMIDELLKNQA